jgi:catechol 2,3-dioxygenase-like lactoylglutathione lyase family enzyme
MFVIAVPDLERSAAFYRDALGFAVHEIGDPGCGQDLEAASSQEVAR